MDALHADLVQIRNFFKRPLQSRESRLPDHSHHHTPRAELHSHQYRHSYRPRALGRLCHTIVHSRVRVRASAPLLAHSTCTARTRGAIEHAAANFET